MASLVDNSTMKIDKCDCEGRDVLHPLCSDDEGQTSLGSVQCRLGSIKAVVERETFASQHQAASGYASLL